MTISTFHLGMALAPVIDCLHIPYVNAEANMERSIVFKNNESQAIRLPNPVAFPDGVKNVDIVKLGRARLITPAGESWDVWFDRKAVAEDFVPEREQPDRQERNSLYGHRHTS